MKRLSTLFVFLLISGMISAQNPVKIGVQLGINMSSLPAERNEDSLISSIKSSSMLGFQTGLFMRIPIKRIIIQPEVLFSMKGGDITYNFSKPDSATMVNSITKKMRIYNFDIPILLGYNLIDKEMFKFRLMAGPIASLIIDKTIDVQATGIHADLAKTDLNSLTWKIQFGAGIDIGKFSLDSRYEMGLGDLSKISAESIKSRAFMILIGLKF